METLGVRSVPAVLIVDDYEDAIEMYATYLDSAGFRCLKASDGHQALRVAGDEHPDIILMDLSLPDMDGFEVTRRLKGDPRTHLIPVIALTAHAGMRQIQDLLDSGFDGLITKPCPPDVVADHLNRYVTRTTEPAQPAA